MKCEHLYLASVHGVYSLNLAESRIMSSRAIWKATDGFSTVNSRGGAVFGENRAVYFESADIVSRLRLPRIPVEPEAASISLTALISVGVVRLKYCIGAAGVSQSLTGCLSSPWVLVVR